MCTREPDAEIEQVDQELDVLQENQILKDKVVELEELILQARNHQDSDESPQDLEFEPIEDNNWSYYVHAIASTKQMCLGWLSEETGLADTEDWLLADYEDPTVENEDVWCYHYEKVKGLQKHVSDKILQEARNVSFLYNVIDWNQFWTEYNKHWETETERHIAPFYSKDKWKYLFMCQYYLLLCIGLYYSDDCLQQEIGYSSEEWELFPKVFFSCAFQCLMRGRILTYPDVMSVQCFCLLRLCSPMLGGYNLQNCLLEVMCYHARLLDLDKLSASDDSTKILCWWSLVIIDWHDSDFRYSSIQLNSFSTPLPCKYALDKRINEHSYYHFFNARVALIKKRYYYNPSPSLDQLITAEAELHELEMEQASDLEQFSSSMPCSLQIKFLIKFILLYEKLTICCKIASCISKSEWLQKYHRRSFAHADQIVRIYLSPDTPTAYRKPWFLADMTVSAMVFLLVDAFLNEHAICTQEKAVGVARQLVAVLTSFSQLMRPALRGAQVIERLVDFLIRDASGIARDIAESSSSPVHYGGLLESPWHELSHTFSESPSARDYKSPA
ncbi:hypothetical protein HPODL_01756 [Ogataea parapolymorpha DL-1]|uniref:Transcription factor domain-containing protein n=1 Tax=Ogataea parapolymorpha (strain ATCC 26012 / BCRC 20466 / JCM 22074 / NRRL Y-7560 / DL-1) TaxID=871575 RepID=W1QA11_OGAPD|nr:hypothetical protein HPODL_01756 [Ogataea parapolymorpha DL-1]ESW97665.1 hypothetical protein HPODL_01756 [Ogataea parapolymorpha DL-1]